MKQDQKSDQPELPLPPRRNRTASVGRDAAALGSGIFARAGFRNPTLVTRWADIVGPEVARICQPVKLSEGASGGVLTLKAEPGASLFLQHESRLLCEKINAYLGHSAVVRLRFVQGPLATRPAPRTRRKARGDVGPDDPALAYNGPEGLKSALLALAKTRRTAD
jgi:hypothetical protein